MIEIKKNVEPGITPEEITVSMIDQDLKDGISKPEMAIKYGIKPWEVDEMFKHPDLKGRRPSRKKTLSFKFVDDTELTKTFLESQEDEEVKIDPNQVTLEQAIDEAIESVEVAKEAIEDIVEEIDEIFPTEIVDIPNGDTLSDTDDELEEEELKMNDSTFEL